LSEFETIIGLEVHVELLTKTKLFCSCSTAFGAEPNTQVCPICLGLPGEIIPVLNRKALEYAIKAALALNCDITDVIDFDRKNYFYADLPKGYQRSQFFNPMGTNGYVEIEVGGSTKRIGIKQLHLEEDAGKLLHTGDDIITSPFSLVDFNRAGIPLIEIVTEPDIRSAEEARLFLQELRNILRYIAISDCKLEEGSMRADANVSLRPLGSNKFGNKTELKNMNSFRSVFNGIEYEVKRQSKILREGGEVLPETRHWDEDKGVTKGMRSKFASADYRCFPDANFLPYELSTDWIEKLKDSLPELPLARRRRLMDEYGLPAYDAEVLTSSRELADYYDATLRFSPAPKVVSNWVMGEILRLLKAAEIEITECKITPENLAELLRLIEKGEISGKIAKEVLEEMSTTGEKAESIVQRKGLAQISDEDTLRKLAIEVIAANPRSVEDYRSGKKKAIGFLVGQIMRKTKGKANPQLVNKVLEEELNK
jgi:aspartyl-tRNA(Asn)/glutamyl-tRNA(Gln) amidotransferase subunit B